MTTGFRGFSRRDVVGEGLGFRRRLQTPIADPKDIKGKAEKGKSIADPKSLRRSLPAVRVAGGYGPHAKAEGVKGEVRSQKTEIRN